MRNENSDCLKIPETQGIKYAGSKRKLLPHILRLAQSTQAKSVLDGFAGTTRVSQAFAQTGYKVFCNDISAWSEIFGWCYLKNKKGKEHYQEIIDYLNDLPPQDGWFSEHYGGIPDGKSSSENDGFKKPWQIHNTRKLDAIRAEIDNLNLEKCEKSVVLTSLILALDSVDNTLGHYAAYLNEWSPRSYRPMKLKVPRLFNLSDKHQVFRRDIFETIEKTEIDLAYFDPPYGSNNEKMPPSRIRYAAYYHIWTSVILNDKPKIFGKAKRRADTSDTNSGSIFEEFRKTDTENFIAIEAIEKLLAKTNAKHIILSYSSGGRATSENLHEILQKAGKIIEFQKIDHCQNVMSAMRWTNNWIRESEKSNQEYLFLIER